MLDIKTLGILTIDYNIIEMKDADDPENCRTNTSQEIDAIEAYYTNTNNVLKFESKDKPMVTDNDNNTIKYFPPGPNSDSDNHTITTKGNQRCI